MVNKDEKFVAIFGYIGQIRYSLKPVIRSGGTKCLFGVYNSCRGFGNGIHQKTDGRVHRRFKEKHRRIIL